MTVQRCQASAATATFDLVNYDPLTFDSSHSLRQLTGLSTVKTACHRRRCHGNISEHMKLK